MSGHGDISDRFLLFEYQDPDQLGMCAVHRPLHAKMCSWGMGSLFLKRGLIQMNLDEFLQGVGIGAPASVPLSYSSALENKWSDVEPYDAIIMPPSSTVLHFPEPPNSLTWPLALSCTETI